MSYLVRKEIGPAKPISKFKDNTNKFTDLHIRVLFNELSDSPLLKDFYGFYVHTRIMPISSKFFDYNKIAANAKGKFNAYAVIYAISDDQLYRSKLTKTYGADLSQWPEDVIKKCAEDNCNSYVEALNKALDKSREHPEHDLKATLMNKSIKLIRNPGYGTLWTEVIIKISYKTNNL